ncbi:hypothetical protein CRE_18083 [Caenorhabditis remanei]|uniref:F-box domain-containing protein n=1 Tax=Caenorhabditis remanei TaxID=31234 RepID=E3MTY2_CAERE|nr:hypothetical protein CRE_18083 [Caenorhabditis remanei]
MKLLRFPSLVQQKIFELMGFHSLLILSFCSKRIKHLIQSLQRYRWKDIKFVNYSFVELNEIHITVGFDIKSERIYLFPYKGLVTNPMRVFGMDPEVSCSFDTRLCGSKYTYNTEEKQRVVQGIHDYLYQFFGSSIDYEVESMETHLPPSLKNINSSRIKVPQNTTAEQLEACFTASPNQEYIEIGGHFTGNLCPNSVILGTEYLRIYCSAMHGDDILLRFRGKRLDVGQASFHDSTIVRFLNDWRTNKTFENLKSLLINSYDYKNYDAGKLLQDVGIKKMSQSEGILRLTWQMRLLYSTFLNFPRPPHRKWIPSAFESRDYLIRDGDGEKASVFIEDHYVCFAVWNGSSCVTNHTSDKPNY